MQFADPLGILDVNISVITATVVVWEGSIALTLSNSPLLLQIDKWCDFIDGSGNLLASTDVTLVS